MSRLTLYEKIGPGIHPCHWCGKGVAWTRGITPTALVVDHLDWDNKNDAADNLVPSCQNCNARRAAPGRRGAIQPDEPVVYVGGNRTRAVERICEECGAKFLTVPSKPGRFCSRDCRVAGTLYGANPERRTK